eukprot:scaffold6143_cov147-Skeletonema_dohrnii-CCMP3373.AAC.3
MVKPEIETITYTFQALNASLRFAFSYVNSKASWQDVAMAKPEIETITLCKLSIQSQVAKNAKNPSRSDSMSQNHCYCCRYSLSVCRLRVSKRRSSYGRQPFWIYSSNTNTSSSSNIDAIPGEWLTAMHEDSESVIISQPDSHQSLEQTALKESEHSHSLSSPRNEELTQEWLTANSASIVNSLDVKSSHDEMSPSGHSSAKRLYYTQSTNHVIHLLVLKCMILPKAQPRRVDDKKALPWWNTMEDVTVTAFNYCYCSFVFVKSDSNLDLDLKFEL